MKTIKILLLVLFIGLTGKVFAQELSNENVAAIMKNDDDADLNKTITKDNINTCLDGYSMLSQAVRYNAKKCFDLLIEKGADVNLICNGYVPPLMHAAKYGRLEMAKVLVAKGADINYKYDGDYVPANGETPLTYAEKYKQTTVADYLRTLK